MAEPTDHEWIWKIVAGLWAAVTALATWAWHHTHKLVDGKADGKALDALTRRVEEHTISRDMFEQHVKSDDQQLAGIAKEMDTQRANVVKLFEKIEEAVDRTEVRFSRIEQQAHDRHVQLLEAIHAVGRQGGKR